VDVVPGPSAALAALVISGLPTDRFAFEGFLPRKGAARRARLAELAGEPRTLLVYESPRRLGALLADAAAALGDRPAAVVRELTKAHQEVVRGSLPELSSRFAETVPRGEVVVVVGGAPTAGAPDVEELGKRVQALITSGASRREAAARIAAETGTSRREVYEASLRHRSSV
jgi:16S rRNA (cytidine1402-2'-O)-methyltransferase